MSSEPTPMEAGTDTGADESERMDGSKGTGASDSWQPLPGQRVNEALLRQALTHRSYEDAAENNERLEFLGDAVLELIVSEHVYHAHPDFTEGELTKARVMGVSEPSLAEAARKAGLGPLILMSRGEEMSGGRDRPSILSDAFEAVVAAIYLDLGLPAAREFVLRYLTDALGNTDIRDFKSLLQEQVQEHLRVTPTYNIVGEAGPPHDRRFVAEVEVAGTVRGRGSGRSKKEAEQAAAQSALEGLDEWIHGQT